MQSYINCILQKNNSTEPFGMKNFYKGIYVLLFFFILACTPDNKEAQTLLNTARQFYTEKKYSLAKLIIDSLNTVYPKAFAQRQAGIFLLDSIRESESLQTIETCDSLIQSFLPKVEQQKKLFSFQQDKRYQETGSYIPKEIITSSISGTTLRSGVEENGNMYIESVFLGSQKHNKIKVSSKEGSFVESIPVNDDGLNYRFSHMGKTYEIIRFSGSHENGIAKFISINTNKPLSVTLDGSEKHTYSLSQHAKSAITKSYLLSEMMLQLDSLRTAKEKAEYQIYYLKNKKDGTDNTKQE